MWYYISESTQFGPVSEEEIKKLIVEGGLTQQSKVWREGMKKWQPLALTVLSEYLPGGRPMNLSGADLPFNSRHPRVKRQGLRKLFIWWLVTYGLSIGYYGLFGLMGTIVSNPDKISDQFPALFVGLMCVFGLFLFASAILTYVILYKFWRVVQDGYASTSAGKAVGFMFIPFFNFYWMFRAYWGLSKDLNQYIQRHFRDRPVEELHYSKEWYSLGYLIFSTAGGLIISVVVQIINLSTVFMYRSIPAASTDYFSMMMPTMIIMGIYFVGTLIADILMHVDFFKTADSILKAEDQS
ncbi:MAG: DUF4339 domain-containing protein [Anaerolineaceae bacterium]|nr:DUF4339 domain-containing protein [Anaerolineaceae bacterium]